MRGEKEGGEDGEMEGGGRGGRRRQGEERTCKNYMHACTTQS